MALKPDVWVDTLDLNWDADRAGTGLKPYSATLTLNLGHLEGERLIRFWTTQRRLPSWSELVAVFAGTGQPPAIPDGSCAGDG